MKRERHAAALVSLAEPCRGPWGSATYEALRAAGVDVSFRTFSGAHEMTAPEIADVLAFLLRRLLGDGETSG